MRFVAIALLAAGCGGGGGGEQCLEDAGPLEGAWRVEFVGCALVDGGPDHLVYPDDAEKDYIIGYSGLIEGSCGDEYEASKMEGLRITISEIHAAPARITGQVEVEVDGQTCTADVTATKKNGD